ncbi:MAG: AAA-like domain-containing protein [Acidobacteria bacterium]|nr:AAA-like domain-containing protein [Acidobacteriota bacterium]
MSKIFISYKAEDETIVRQIASGLEGAGYSTFFYGRRALPGTNYLTVTREEVDKCEAVLVLISSRSLNSVEVTTEIVHAHQTCKCFVPILVDVTYEEFQRRRPDWHHVMAAAVADRIPETGAAGILPNIVEGLRAMQVLPDGKPLSAAPATANLQIVLLYKRDAHPDEELLRFLETELLKLNHRVFFDQRIKTGTRWRLEIEDQIRSADAVIPLLSSASAHNEMLEWEVGVAHEAAQERAGKPYLIPVRVNYEGPLSQALAYILDSLQYSLWHGTSDNEKLLGEVTSSLITPPKPKRAAKFHPAGGGMPLETELYVVRPTDLQFAEAIDRGDSIVLIKGSRQMGKTSLVARGLQQARTKGSKVVFSDLQTLTEADLKTADSFYQALVALISDELELECEPAKIWRPGRTANMNFERFLKNEVLAKLSKPLVWAMDEADRLFDRDYGTEVCSLFRTFFNKRATDPGGKWDQLTLVIVYATEAYLFIKDPNQSPFNVGTRISVADFTLEQVTDLNRRYDQPLRSADEIKRFYSLVGGNPYLVQRGLQELKAGNSGIAHLEGVAARDDGPFGDHLRRILVILSQKTQLEGAVRSVLNGQNLISNEDFVRLRSHGLMAGDSAQDVHPRCQLYATYLKTHLG